MRVRIVRIGNSQGIRLPRRLLSVYGLDEGDSLELSETREGIVLRPVGRSQKKLGWADAYREMAAEAAEREEWTEWGAVAGDGIDD